jgi:4-hydroxy-2-oxoheptanedioate aldolase
MRKSRVLQKLRAGELVSCVKMNLSCARTSELAAALGFDCIWLDMEHTAADWGEVEKHIMAAKTRDTDVMVRVTRGSYSDYIRPLELDATGIMVPHIMSLEDAKRVVWMTRFHPIGRRPIDGGNADGTYCNVALSDYLSQANDQRFLVVQIEDPEPLDDLEAIASLEGIDMLFFGPADFSHGIGAPGDFKNPRVLETRKRVAEAALAHGKFAGTIGGIDNVDEFAEMGYRFISIGADVTGLSQHFKWLLEEYEKRQKKFRSP